MGTIAVWLTCTAVEGRNLHRKIICARKFVEADSHMPQGKQILGFPQIRGLGVPIVRAIVP